MCGDLAHQGGHCGVAHLDALRRRGDLGGLGELTDIAALLGKDKGDHIAAGAGAGRTTGAVQVCLVLCRRVHVHHEVNVIHVNAASRDVGCDHHAHFTGVERCEVALAGVLRKVAVQVCGRDALLGELARHLTGLVLGPHEQQTAAGARSEALHDRLLLVSVADLEEVVRQSRDRRVGRVHGVRDRAVEVALDQDVHAVIERGREQQTLTALGRRIQDALHAGKEAEVGHVVGLIQHGDLDGVQAHVTLTHQVLKAAGAGHHDVNAAVEGADLLALGHATEDRGDGQASCLGQRSERLGDLVGELTGGSKHEGARPVRASVLAASKAGNQREAEGDRLTGAGAATAEHVAASQGVREGGDLDRERGVDAASRKARDEVRGDAELGEGDNGLGRCRGRGRQGGARRQGARRHWNPFRFASPGFCRWVMRGGAAGKSDRATGDAC